MARAAAQREDPLAFLATPTCSATSSRTSASPREYAAALDSLHEHGARATLEELGAVDVSQMLGVRLPGNSTVEAVTRAGPRAGPRPGAAGDEGVVDLRQRHPRDLPRAPRQRAGGLPGRDRRSRAVRPGGRGRPGLQAARPRATGSSSTTSPAAGSARSAAAATDRLHLTRRARRTAGSATAATRSTCSPRRAPACCCPTRCPTSTARWCRAASARPTRRCCGSGSPAWTACSSPASGPVGLAAAMLARAMGAGPVVGTDVSPERRRLAVDLGAGRPRGAGRRRAPPTPMRSSPPGAASRRPWTARATPAARLLALASTATWGRCAFVGEGGDVGFDVSPLMIHKQVALHGSWVTSLRHMEELSVTWTAGSCTPSGS